MTIGAIAVPLAPAVAWALLDLFVAVTFVVCLGLLWTWKRTIGRAFVWIGNKSIHASVRGFGFTVAPFGFLLTINEQIQAALSTAVAATEHAMVYAFRRMIGAIIWTGQEISGLAQDTYNAIKGAKVTVTTTVTKVLDAKTQALVRKLTVAVDTVQHVTIPGLRARVKALERTIVRGVKAAGHAIASPFPRIGRLEKTTKAQAKRLTKVEKALAAGVGVALLTRTLAKMGLGWLRCRNVGKAGKAVCGLNPSVLDSLLLDAALLAVAVNLEDFARELQVVTSEAASLIHDLAT